MARIGTLALAVLLIPSIVLADELRPEPAQPFVQIALLLDNSGSMSGLINQARAHLWRVVSEVATAKQGGQSPRLQVALYIYGDPPITRLVELTEDLDKISEQLFAVQINGGSEHCGEVIQMATQQLAWSDSSSDLKMIFIAGNEPFTQGPVDYRQACKEAIAKGIVINTIHCGDGIPDDWRDGAALADGRAMNINHNEAIVQIEAPQDAELARLNGELNATYIAYGAAGEAGLARQAEQDANAATMAPAAASQRIAAKGSAQYTNASWDLVDAVREKKVDVAKLNESELPDQLKNLKPEERQARIEQAAARRAELQEQIQKLGKERQAYVDAELKKQAAQGNGLDNAIVTAVREQAQAKHFTFE